MRESINRGEPFKMNGLFFAAKRHRCHWWCDQAVIGHGMKSITLHLLLPSEAKRKDGTVDKKKVVII